MARIPWVHIDDAALAFVKALEDASLSGAYNIVAPEHITNDAATKVLAHHFNVVRGPNVPAFVLRAMLGEMASLVLEGSRISSARLEQTGFRFRYRALNDAVVALESASSANAQAASGS